MIYLHKNIHLPLLLTPNGATMRIILLLNPQRLAKNLYL